MYIQAWPFKNQTIAAISRSYTTLKRVCLAQGFVEIEINAYLFLHAHLKKCEFSLQVPTTNPRVKYKHCCKFYGTYTSRLPLT